MVKTIGNIVTIVFFSMHMAVGAVNLTLRMVDSNGVPLTQAAAGQPFNVEVTIENINVFGVAPHVAGLDQFDVRATGTHISTVNGRTCAKYKYEVRIDKPGTYTVGPAELMDHNDKYVSNSLQVLVGEQSVEQDYGAHTVGAGHSRKKSTIDKKVLLRLTANKKKVVIGEPVTCTLRFYYNDDGIVLRQLIEQNSQLFTRKSARGPYAGSEKIENSPYQYVEWQWDAYAKQAGKQTITAYGADYEQESQRKDFWGGLGHFFGNRVEVKRIYSNALSLEVDPLPASKEPIQGVGSFSSFTVQAHPSVAKQGEGIVVTVSMVGDGDPDQIVFDGLQNMPDALKCYESKQSVQEPTQVDQPYTKQYEYVVQGLKTGSWSIPEQTFHYYDVQKKKFATLKSEPIMLTIMPGVQKHALPEDQDREKSESDDDQLVPRALHQISDGPVGETIIPWWIIYSIILLPIVFFGMQLVVAQWHIYRAKNNSARRWQHAYKRARESIISARKENHTHKLYGIFNDFFADKKKISVNDVSSELIHDTLRSQGFDVAMCNRWDIFYARIAERAFGITRSNQEDKQLFQEAEQWLEQLARIL